MSSLNPIPKPAYTAPAPGPFRRACHALRRFAREYKLARWVSRGITATFVIGLLLNSVYLYIDKANLTRERDDLRSATARLATHHEQSDRDFAALRDNYHALTSVRAALEQSNADVNLRITQFQQQNQTLVTANSTLSATKVGLENAKATATKQIQQLQVQLDSLTRENRDITASNADLKQQLSDLGAKLQRSEQANRDLAAAIKEWRLKAETPVDRLVPVAVQTSGTIIANTQFSWGSGDISLTVLPTLNTYIDEHVRLEFKVGDDTTPLFMDLGIGSHNKSVVIKGLRGELTFEGITASYLPAMFGFFRQLALLQFKASYRPLTTAPPTPTAK